MKSKLKIMPASSSSMSSSSGNGGCRDCHNHSVSVCHLCDMGSQNVTTCPIMSCTPIDALPGYQDQQRYPLPPIPRERGRSRVIRGRPLPWPAGGGEAWTRVSGTRAGRAHAHTQAVTVPRGSSHIVMCCMHDAFSRSHTTA